MNHYRRILKNHKRALCGLCLLTIFASFLSVLAGYSLGGILDAYAAERKQIQSLICKSIISLALWATAIIVDHISMVCRDKMQRIIKNTLRELAATKMALLPYHDFCSRDSGAYVSWLNNDVEQLYQQSFDKIFVSIEWGFKAAFSFIAISLCSWYIGLTAILLFTLMIITPKFFDKALHKATARRSQAMENSLEAYKDTVMGCGIFYLANLRKQIIKRLLQASDQAEQEIFYCNRTTRRATTIVTLVNFSNQILLTSVATLAAITGNTPIGTVFSVSGLSGQFFNGLKITAEAIMAVRSSKPLWDKFTPEKELPAPMEETDTISHITMENLSFSYGSKNILENRNFSFQAGKKYALLGESGSGKTTLAKLLMGLMPNYTGKIYYNSQEQREIHLPNLYSQIAYVEQQVYLFQDTIRFNITLGEPYSDEEIMRIAKICKLETLIYSLPDGLNSIITENGKNLSGGQRQRIALARALIRKVSYLILDEGTSALDEQNATDIEESLLATKNLGIIFITHNLRPQIRERLNAIYEI